MIEKVGSYILVFAGILFILQEDFLMEKTPFIFLYSCKILLKILNARENFGEGRTVIDFIQCFLLCFGKKIIFDAVFYQIHFQKYLRYTVTMICLDYILGLLLPYKIKAKVIIKHKSVKTLLALASSISDSISLENLLWRNELSMSYFPVIFLSVFLDPVVFTLTNWILKRMQKERCKSLLKRGFIFGAILTLVHFICSRNNYTTLIDLRRQVPFISSNVLTIAVGIRLLNCLTFIGLQLFELVKDDLNKISPVFIKDNFVKSKPVKKEEDETLSTEASDSVLSITSLTVEQNKSD